MPDVETETTQRSARPTTGVRFGLARVSGTVRTGDGRVGAGGVESGGAGDGLAAMITLVDRHGRQHGRTSTVDGRYELVLPGPGAWQLIVVAPAHAPRADRLMVTGCPRTRMHDVIHDVVLSPGARGLAAAPGR